MTRVFDPLDAECEYKQNPTKQSKTVDKGSSTRLMLNANASKIRQSSRRLLTRAFSPSVGDF
ncbi:MAG: hypothetical protein FWC11_02685 [Firmicutes bacterium]|nr:hypothetical protein [Bacillota bacterium]